ncbi:MAG TPA: diaminopimelate epimerase, partial [Vicinamibacteria bacterium]
VEIVSPTEIRMAIWERGVGETASSGTGSSASAVASIWNGLARSPLRVHCPGGVMTLEWNDGGEVFLEGEAAVVAEGNYIFEGLC